MVVNGSKDPVQFFRHPWFHRLGSDPFRPTKRLTEFQKFAEKESHANPAENKTVITSFVEEVINQGQLERADDLVVVDFLELDPLPGQQQGCEGLKQVIGAFRTAFPDIHWVIEEMIGEGEKVFSRFTWHGTHRGRILRGSCHR